MGRTQVLLQGPGTWLFAYRINSLVSQHLVNYQMPALLLPSRLSALFLCCLVYDKVVTGKENEELKKIYKNLKAEQISSAALNFKVLKTLIF